MKPHAFQRRDDFTWAECFHIEADENGLRCNRNDRAIRYDPRRFGCGEFGVRDEHMVLPLTLTMFGGME